jgi:hypothetical protein
MFFKRPVDLDSVNIIGTYERRAVLIPKFGNIDNYLILVCCLFKYKDTVKVLRKQEEIINAITEFSKEGDEKYKPVLYITHLDRFFKLFDLPFESRFPSEGDSIIEAVTDSGVIVRDTTKLCIDTDTHSWLLDYRLHSESEIPDNLMSEMMKELDYTYDFVSNIKAHGFTINQRVVDEGRLCFVNENYIGKTLTDVHSFDLTSAYHYVMVTKKVYTSDPYATVASIKGHLRNIMLDIILKLGNDFVCCHTDSIKFLNYEKNKHIFEEHNEKVRKELEEMRDNFTLPLEMCSEEGIKQREAYIQDFKNTIDKVLSFENILGSFKYGGVSKKFKILDKNMYIADDNTTFFWNWW